MQGSAVSDIAKGQEQPEGQPKQPVWVSMTPHGCSRGLSFFAIWGPKPRTIATPCTAHVHLPSLEAAAADKAAWQAWQAALAGVGTPNAAKQALSGGEGSRVQVRCKVLG